LPKRFHDSTQHDERQNVPQIELLLSENMSAEIQIGRYAIVRDLSGIILAWHEQFYEVVGLLHFDADAASREATTQ